MYNPVYDDAVIFINSPRYIDESLRRLAPRKATAFQFEIFDLGFLGNVRRLMDRGLLRADHRRFWLNYVLGYGGLPADPQSLAIVSGEGLRLFPGVPWGVTVPTDAHFRLAALGAALGADCLRTGFEDTIALPDGSAAGTNARLVEALVRIVRDAGREVASPQEARTILGLRVGQDER